ncbi:hypothetical protein PHYBOEH_000970 [Phytophthora boehmeriae]|uniref:Peroxisomal membrane protein PEX14 n=1 Tax=Phytophthora boehmeriae TaxID=109152 RepID=A0A8T1WV00_9STRA|nr:hypothetical protein PHYBOEH_000970 [Phytophthora boehmeriae]
MAPPRDSGLLEKCEQFLLHPTVRALSLAQRVDFLEKKGLSPEEITQCLKTVERRNGLSQLARRTAADLAANAGVNSLTLPSDASPAAPASKLTLLKLIVKKYGVITLLLALLSYGYMQFRRRRTEQLALEQQRERLQRRERRSVKVEALLAVIQDQQKQYNEAAELLRRRTDKFLAAQQTAHSQEVALKTNSSATQTTRGLELQKLQSELMELKSVVVDTYLHPPVAKKEADKVKDLPMVLRPAEASVLDNVSDSSTGLRFSPMSVGAPAMARPLATRTVLEEKYMTMTRNRRKPRERQEDSTARNQTTLSSSEIEELLGDIQSGEEISTAGSYRLLFATE